MSNTRALTWSASTFMAPEMLSSPASWLNCSASNMAGVHRKTPVSMALNSRMTLPMLMIRPSEHKTRVTSSGSLIDPVTLKSTASVTVSGSSLDAIRSRTMPGSTR